MVARWQRYVALSYSYFLFPILDSFRAQPRRMLHVTVTRPRPPVASGAGGAPSPGPTAPASPSLSTAATTPALAALSPRHHRPSLASPRRASERGVRPSQQLWSPEPAAGVASSSTRSATAPGREAAEELNLIFVVVLVRARGGVRPARKLNTRVCKWRGRERRASHVANDPVGHSEVTPRESDVI